MEYSILLLIALFISSFDSHFAQPSPAAPAPPPPQQVPCYFIFGDSLVDSGNNNIFGDLTRVRANYNPYGIDFADGPTGRFTNGKTQVDVLAELLGFEEKIPPYVSVSGNKILQGVNYGSGGSGIEGDTGRNRGANFNMDEQLSNHREIVIRFNSLLGIRQSAVVLKQCLYTVNMGTRDFLKYFGIGRSPLRRIFNPDQYATRLIDRYYLQMRSLHASGARKIALFGLGLIGCTPYATTVYDHNFNETCIDFINNAAFSFNDKLQALVARLNRELPDATFTYINTVGISDLAGRGFTVTDRACCAFGEFGVCGENGNVCPDRNLYAFFDEFNPTEKLNVITAGRAYKSLLPTDATPFDISTLVQQ